MSQELQRPEEQEPIKYGEVFHVQGELAKKPVSPGDASTTQAFENSFLGKTQKRGAAAVMHSVATLNEKLAQQTDGSGKCTTVLEQYSQAVSLPSLESGNQQGSNLNDAITIGEALEATALTAGNKPVEWSDAAAIQAAEVRATGRTSIMPGGIAARAQSAATLNARTSRVEEKIKLADILTNATVRLPADKPVTRKDAEGVTGAEMRNDPNLTTHPAGVAASVAAAARLNQIK
ncbi:hypothetical protein SLEP1_g19145 [Rubroshorea leprosula]|nr:hypothetical protein SLEP1_g19145 [Rubroshorea leprosula]